MQLVPKIFFFFVSRKWCSVEETCSDAKQLHNWEKKNTKQNCQNLGLHSTFIAFDMRYNIIAVLGCFEYWMDFCRSYR